MSTIKNRVRAFYDWFRESDGVEKASRTERLKRDVWMMGSFTVTFAAMSMLLAVVTGVIIGLADINPGMVDNVLAAVVAFGATLYIDSKYVFPWGVERFDITIPWQFREGQNGE